MDFHKPWLILSGKIFFTTSLFLILEISKKSLNAVILEKKNSFNKFYLTIAATENFTFKIKISKVVEYFSRKNKPSFIKMQFSKNFQKATVRKHFTTKKNYYKYYFL